MSRKILDIKKVRESREERDRSALEAVKSSQPNTKPVRLREKRRRQQMIALGLLFLGTAALLGGLGGMSHLDRFEIQDIQVQGAVLLSTPEVQESVNKSLSRNSFELFSRRNMFMYPQKNIEESLATAFPRIKTIEITRDALFAQSLKVIVRERDPYATWCAGKLYTDCYVMDKEGYVYAKRTTERPETQYIFRGGMISEGNPIGQTYLLGRLEKISALLAYLAQNGFGAEGIDVQNDKDFEVPLLRGPVLKISFETDPADLVRNMELALESETLRDKFTMLEYIDLRFGNRVYFKMKGQVAVHAPDDTLPDVGVREEIDTDNQD